MDTDFAIATLPFSGWRHEVQFLSDSRLSDVKYLIQNLIQHPKMSSVEVRKQWNCGFLPVSILPDNARTIVEVIQYVQFSPYFISED